MDTERKKEIKSRALTSCQGKREGQVKTPKESEQARRTYFLPRTEKGISQMLKENEQADHTHILLRAKVRTSKKESK